MSSLLDKLSEPATWQEYQAYKTEFAQLSQREQAELNEFIQEERWKPVVERLLPANGGLGIPTKRLINKFGKSTKRVVYSFAAAEQQVLKVLAWLLYCYDDVHSPQCYSFRRGTGAHRAIRRLTSLAQIDSLYCYKLDIHDYFNSIDVESLLPILARVLSDDRPLYDFFADFLQTNQAVFEGEQISEQRGVMAGTPTAPFLANLYLGEMDRVLSSQAVAYARYSDDIIIFAESAEQLGELQLLVQKLLADYGLEINASKETCSGPGEAWEFLGVSYQQGTIDLSAASRRKLKTKIRRKARALRRWMLRKPASSQRATAAMIRSMNRKFFERGDAHELTWSRWFFPLITTSKSLAAIDAYLQQELRTIATGRHRKANYRQSYSQLKQLGYRNLVHEYYRFREARKTL